MDAARPSRDLPAADAESGAAPIAASLSKAGKAIADHYLRRILTARVYDVALESPLEPAKNLSRRLNNHVLLKREDCQPVFSFKLRGAYNKMAHLSPEALGRGVICASAGNHAQGVALGARKLGVRAVIVMPVTTPRLSPTPWARSGARSCCTATATPTPTSRPAVAGAAWIHLRASV